jgi:hypothetical protein
MIAGGSPRPGTQASSNFIASPAPTFVPALAAGAAGRWAYHAVADNDLQ